MLVVYASRTGNIRRFVGKINDIKSVFIGDIKDVVNEPFVLITYTDGFGETPKEVFKFLETNYHNLIGVSASGNRNWGSHLFGVSADEISRKYNVPIISKFEMSGMQGDVNRFREGVFELYGKMDRTEQ